MSGMHFERMAAEYSGARPPYPEGLYRALRAAGVTGPGRRVLEIGAGAGLATAELVRSGTDVVALEPGQALIAELRAVVPDVEVVAARLEDAELPRADFDAVAAAMSLHWVDLAIGLPKLHRALRPRGLLAVWRTQFGEQGAKTEFRHRIDRIVAGRERDPEAQRVPSRPTMEELGTGGWFEPISTEQWRWTVDLTTDQVRRLFRTFSNWEPAEVTGAAQAAADLGGVVTEHYRTVLHLLRRCDR